MEKEDIIWIASKAAVKGWSYETLKYGDDLYNNENMVDEVWQHVIEYKKLGSIAFTEKYKNFDVYTK